MAYENHNIWTVQIAKEPDVAYIYSSVWHRCYGTIARRNMRCLVAAGKHVNDIRAIARQRAHMSNTKTVGGGVFCWVRPEAI
jgi:hypothetical protein